MKTTKPSGAAGHFSLALVAANEPTMPEAARKEAAPDSRVVRGWDPYDIWRTRVKAQREHETPPL
ncbi:MAG: hypothetical protein NAOJABEB_02793 [Steroidobacteraceae bacterium]|nr:hypothetical protein [Steroidobacteraceae bacterium]